MRIGPALKVLRIAAEMTQQAVADAIGRSKQNVSRAEKDGHGPTWRFVVSYLVAVGATPLDLAQELVKDQGPEARDADGGASSEAPGALAKALGPPKSDVEAEEYERMEESLRTPEGRAELRKILQLMSGEGGALIRKPFEGVLAVLDEEGKGETR